MEARVHHTSPERSRVYYKLSTRDLLYKSDGTGGPFHARVRISYESYNGYGSKVLLDSASTLIDDETVDPSEDKELIGSMDLRRKEQRSFVLKIMAHDLNRDQRSTTYLRVEKDGLGIRQYFMPVDTAKGLPLFTDHFDGRTVRVRCEVCAGQELVGAHYTTNTALPVPVFTASYSTAPATPTEVADSTFRVQVDADGLFTMDLRKPGVYHVKPDTATLAGYSIFSVEDAFPYVSDAQDMLKPMRYITSNQEYERLSKSTNVRFGSRAVLDRCSGASGARTRSHSHLLHPR
ncbi:MAG: hypothetical protein IPN30_06585 [Flavobacteriales bacterium]|nr:hypothetical protein [Flavobacteriales bacterium]